MTCPLTNFVRKVAAREGKAEGQGTTFGQGVLRLVRPAGAAPLIFALLGFFVSALGIAFDHAGLMLGGFLAVLAGFGAQEIGTYWSMKRAPRDLRDEWSEWAARPYVSAADHWADHLYDDDSFRWPDR